MRVLEDPIQTRGSPNVPKIGTLIGDFRADLWGLIDTPTGRREGLWYPLWSPCPSAHAGTLSSKWPRLSELLQGG